MIHANIDIVAIFKYLAISFPFDKINFDKLARVLTGLAEVISDLEDQTYLQVPRINYL